MNTNLIRYGIYSTLALIFIALSPATMQMMNQSKFVGHWSGALHVGKMQLRIVFHVSNGANGLNVFMDSPDQGAKDIATGNVQAFNDSLTFDVPVAAGRFESRISPHGDTLTGIWKQGTAALPLTLTKQDSMVSVEYRRPQTPKPPFPYRSIDVSYTNPIEGNTLAGTLTIPEGKGPFPAVVLITGSGSQNRDEEIMGHKPFFVLSDYLTRRGIAVLRVDDRGVGGSSGVNRKATTSDFTGDVLAGVEYLKSRNEVSAKAIGLIGHSEGGIIAPLAATRSNDVAFVVMMAGTGLPGGDIVKLQSALMAKAEGVSDHDIELSNKLFSIMFENLKKNLDSAETMNGIVNDIDLYVGTLPDSDQTKKSALLVEAKNRFTPMFNPWFKFFLTYDPRPTLKKVSCPVLAINGSKDLQVPPEKNLMEIERALKAGGNIRYTLKEFDGLNHLFQHAETGSPLEYAKIEETIAPEVLQYIGDWIELTVKQ